MKRSRIAMLIFVMVLLISFAYASQLKSLQGRVVSQSGNPIDNGNLTVAIYSSSTGGAPVYNSSNDFNGTIQDGYFDVMLGSGSVALELNFSQHYWLEVYVNDELIDFGGRAEFEASTGTILNGNFTIAETLTVSDVNVSSGIDLGGVYRTTWPTGYLPGANLNLTLLNVSSSLMLGGVSRSSWPENCSSSGSCSAITYDGELDNGSVVRNHNTTWITANAYNEGDNANFTNLNASGTVIFSNGNVGIGTTSPYEQLSVVTDYAGLAYPLKVSNIDDQDVGILFMVDDAGGEPNTDVDRGKGAIVYEMTAGWNHGSFHFLQNSANDASKPDLSDSVMTITNGGNVGIGTTSPNEKLTVVGNINVTGNITFETKTKRKLIEAVTAATGNSPNSSRIGYNPTISFDSDNNQFVYFNFIVPDDWESGTDIKIRINYAPLVAVADTTTTNFSIKYRVLTFGEVIDSGGNYNVSSVSIDPPNTAKEFRWNNSLDIASSDINAKELVAVNLSREANSTSDTYNSTLDILAIEMEYESNILGE